MIAFHRETVIRIKTSEDRCKSFMFVRVLGWKTVLTLTSPKARSRHAVSFIKPREMAGPWRLSKAANISGNSCVE